MKRIIVAGSGIGGTIVANRLAERLRKEIDAGEVEIVAVDKSDKHIYQPGQLFVGLGLEDASEIVRDERPLLNRRVKFVSGKAGEMTKIDVNEHSITTADGKIHKYDYLVLSTGSHNDWDMVPGLKDSLHTAWDYERAMKMREAVSSFQGGTAVINVARLPHKCPVGPLENTMMFDDLMRRRGLRDKTRIVYTYPVQGVFGIPNVNKVMLKLFEEKGIEVISPFTVKSVDPKERIIESNEGEKIKFDLLMGVPPAMGAKVIGDSGIGDRRNWVPTDKFTLQMKDHSDVYVMGDTTDIPISKAGSTADFESYVVTHNIANDIKGNMGKRHYDGSVFCYIATGVDSATYIRFNYNNPPVPPPPSYVHWWGKIMYNNAYWTVTAKAIV
jgi:sulfide:quinone oxidoreductase